MALTSTAKPVSAKPREIIVVAAAISRGESDKEILIARRAPHDQGAGVWEFPGGKVERGESLEQALSREIQEELSVVIKIDRYLGQNDYFLTPDLLMHIHVYEARITSGVIKLIDHDMFEWHPLKSFPIDKISGADQPFVYVLRDLSPSPN